MSNMPWITRALDAKLLAEDLIKEADELADRARVAAGDLADELWERSKKKFRQASKIMDEVI